MYPLAGLLLVIIVFIQFEMATNLIRNVLVIGGSFVGRVSSRQFVPNQTITNWL